MTPLSTVTTVSMSASCVKVTPIIAIVHSVTTIEAPYFGSTAGAPAPLAQAVTINIPAWAIDRTAYQDQRESRSGWVKCFTPLSVFLENLCHRISAIQLYNYAAYRTTTVPEIRISSLKNVQALEGGDDNHTNTVANL